MNDDKIKQELQKIIKNEYDSSKLVQREFAELLCKKQSRISGILNNSIGTISISSLLDFVTKIGWKVETKNHSISRYGFTLKRDSEKYREWKKGVAKMKRLRTAKIT
ncbi:XRE family transcriptional regulator [Vibrio parahaemolyticus]|uniref:XRE family transcriptional regulator n=1 Tax=Vibrio parahaemolyticus TaxID=670 RepID=UPI0016252EEC|nr:XRE family transcriptional regulator [Vibrio parahaemolyticus]EJG0791408.1 XRE family transcriptional regulator [Vibrio parahaemolyticus]EJG1033925.1 XRE family transcriptional regulator [Vibrio parahaemolyticus]QNE57724.1 XRE family transcriptional regulator [Vibrio parahaemolyticus]HDY7454419.1 XRE family transcriptional regulator [Vibrio vulnificus]